MKRNALIAILLSSSLISQGCGSETTLNRIGAVVLVAVNAAQLEIDQLLAQGQITKEKRDQLAAKIAVIRTKAEAFQALINGFAVIKPGDVPAVLLQINGLVALFDDILSDSALGNLAPTNGVIRALRYGVATLNVAAVVVAALFPPTQVQPVTQANRPVIGGEQKGIAPGKIKIPLPQKI